MPPENRITSNRAFIFAIAGAAIGLGNIWRFPYVAGENGGSLFFLLYIIFVVLLGLPVMVAEIVVGRAGRASPASSLRQLAVSAGHTRHWSKLAWMGTMAATMILSFYSVVSGWVLHFFFQSLTGELTANSIQATSIHFQQLLESPWQVVLYHGLFIVMTVAISGRAISKGIERLNNWLMPLMYMILVVLLIYASQFSGFAPALDYLFAFRFEAVSSGVVLEAMGHAFFTLAIGACCLMAYGAYMPERQSVIKAVLVVALLDVLVAVMVGIATFAVVFSEGLSVAEGPGLMFITLPVALAQMPFGSLVLPLFFLLLVMAVWTSAVNLAEPLVVVMSRLCSGFRATGAAIAGVMIFLVGLIPGLSFSVWKQVSLNGKTLFDLYTAFATQVMLPAVGLLVLYFCGYIMERKVLAEQLGMQGKSLKTWQLLIRWVSPALLLMVIIGELFQF
ncbi:sodium-dependent transporter [Salinisphaera sp. G21_0]|uniref:sodium-dependent transporter n=1 Tax=Salinisphaera sp. G21_0 TaxID=2821094 RepID=UPI001AD95C33|nr:sodium-dependent transporter [Salinisphaera sp. G21_0]MBO9483622.1 sodium-dependent transporter [Salinisphaera sp. G21_0]